MDFKYQLSWREFADHIMEDLISEPSTTLAGIDTLRKQHNVSRLTVKRALGYLEELDVVMSSECGKKRKVNLNNLYRIKSLQKPREEGNRVIFLSVWPENHPDYAARNVYDSFSRLCENDSLSLSYVQIPSDITGLRALLSSLNPIAIIIYSASAEVTEAVASTGIPAIKTGGEVSRQLPCFYTEYDKLLFNAFERASAAGHRRVTIPLWYQKESVYEGLADNIETYFPVGSIEFNRRYNFPLIKSAEVKDYHAALYEIFRYTPPTCIILHDLAGYLAATSFFLKQGLRIPDDISVILLSHDPALENVDPSIAHFSLFLESDALQAFDVLKQQIKGLRSAEHVEMQPAWIPGESLAPPPSS